MTTFVVDPEHFRTVVADLLDEFPAWVVLELDASLVVVIEPRSTNDAGRCGWYDGVPVPRRGPGDGLLPSKVYLYRDAIADGGEAGLVDRTRDVLRHEVGHHFGLNHQQMAR